MASTQETIAIQGKTIDELREMVYASFVELGWNPKYVTDTGMIAHTPKKWSAYPSEVFVGIDDELITVDATTLHPQGYGSSKRNKKFIQQFLETFNRLRESKFTVIQQSWRDEIEQLKIATIKKAAEAEEEVAQLNKVMKAGTTIYVTYGIMAVNVLVFIAMIIKGVDLMSPTTLDLLIWGGNHRDLTASGDWWRLLTSVFLHGGLIHLGFNMYALYSANMYLEPILGRGRLLVAYLCTGVLASLTSLAWHNPPTVSVGASGAIFGMYGIFLALLSTRLIPKTMRQQLLSSIVVFVGYNLLYGMKSGIDNAAHVGGLVSGLIIGYIYYVGLKKKAAGEISDQKTILTTALIAIATVGITYACLNAFKSKVDPATRDAFRNLVAGAATKDGKKFREKIEEFGKLETTALAPLQDSAVQMNEALISKLQEISLPAWEKALSITEDLKSYEVTPQLKKRAELLNSYTLRRIEQVQHFEKYVAGEPGAAKAVDAKNTEIDKIIAELNE